MVATRRQSQLPDRDSAADVESKEKVPPATEQPTFTLDIVAQHDSPADCWVIVRRKVYNVTEWVPKHPGGSLIYVKAGRDCTQLFDSYHPLATRKVLEKYYIGDVKLQPGEENVLVDYEEETGEKQFYATLRQRVEKYFRENQINPRISASMYIKTWIILGVGAASYYGTFFAFQSFMLSALCACMFGLAAAEVGVSIQHDANHGAYARTGWLCNLVGTTLDVVGASSFMWKQQHVVGHHAYTNVEGLDPDIRISEKDVRRVNQHQPWHSYQAYQHLYLGWLYGLLAIKSILLDDFNAISSGHIGPAKISKLTPGEQAVFWAGKVLWTSYFLVLPLVKSHHSLGALLVLWVLAQAVTGWTLAFMFQVAHVVPEVEYLQRRKDGKVAKGWAAAQVATTADFAHGSFFWTHISGGLNYQVVHHLFPGICHTHYPKIAPLVLDTCDEFGVPYKVYATFWEALGAHFQQLKNMGQQGITAHIPSLATIG